MQALHHNETWELVPLPYGKHAVSCKWVYHPDGFVDLLQA
jgi:hypothetical protein